MTKVSTELQWSTSCFVFFIICLPGSQNFYVQIPKTLFSKREVFNTSLSKRHFLFNKYLSIFFVVGYALRPGDTLRNKKHSICLPRTYNPIHEK